MLAVSKSLTRSDSVFLAKGVVVASHARLLPWKGCIRVGEGSVINCGTVLRGDHGDIVIGSNASLQYYSVVYGDGGVTIGDNCRISSHVLLLAVNHKFDDLDRPIREQGVQSKGIVLEDDVWVGAGATILDGVRIGRGCVVGAGTVVTKNLPPCAVVVGNPARIVKTR